MVDVMVNIAIIVMWLWIGFRTVKPKLCRIRLEYDEDIKHLYKYELVQYVLLYIMMMLLLLERTLEAIMNL